jgi:hypothetical protein
MKKLKCFISAVLLLLSSTCFSQTPTELIDSMERQVNNDIVFNTTGAITSAKVNLAFANVARALRALRDTSNGVTYPIGVDENGDLFIYQSWVDSLFADANPATNTGIVQFSGLYLGNDTLYANMASPLIYKINGSTFIRSTEWNTVVTGASPSHYRTDIIYINALEEIVYEAGVENTDAGLAVAPTPPSDVVVLGYMSVFEESLLVIPVPPLYQRNGVLYVDGNANVVTDSTDFTYQNTSTFSDLEIGKKFAFSNQTRFGLHGGRAKIIGSAFGMQINVGSGESGVPDPSKHIVFGNRGTVFGEFGCSVNAAPFYNWFKLTDTATVFALKKKDVVTDLATADAVWHNDTLKSRPITYHKWVGLVSQTGTADPVAITLENTFPAGFEPQWHRVGLGNYDATNLSGVAAKRVVFVSPLESGNRVSVYNQVNNKVIFSTWTEASSYATTWSDGLLTNWSVTIIQYF